MTTPEPSLLDVLERLGTALEVAEASYALAGGLALAAWATPRATVDIDLALGAGELDAARRAAGSVGFVAVRKRPMALRRIQLDRLLMSPEHGASSLMLDLLVLPDELASAVMRRAVPLPLGGARLRVASAEDLVLLKLMRFSDQDRADIRALREARRLDARYLLRSAERMRLLSRLRKVGLPGISGR